MKMIVSQLPKTKDGETIYPGMEVFYMLKDIGFPIRSSKVASVSRFRWATRGGGIPPTVRDGSAPTWSTNQMALDYRSRHIAKIQAEALETV